MIFCGLYVSAPPPTQSALGRVWGYSKRKTDPIFEIPTVENHRIDVSHDFLHVFFFNFCRYGGTGGNGGALGRVWGYPKRKTDPIFEIPTVENHRIDVSHDFLHVFFNFAVTAADQTEKLPVLGVVLLKRSHHAKNQPNPSIIVARAD